MKNTTGLLLALAASALFGAIKTPVVDTDRSPNYYTVATLTQDVVKPSMSDEEKAIALWKAHRRAMYHFSLRGAAESWDWTTVMHNAGFCYCTQQAHIFKTLLTPTFGIGNARSVGGPGHGSFEVYYGGQWHWIDPIIGAFARTGADRHIASLAEIAADSAILYNAVADNRASVPYHPCATGESSAPDGVDSAVSYHLYADSFMYYYATHLAGSDASKPPAATTRRFSLKQGETYTWLWDFLPGDYFIPCHPSYPDKAWKYYPPQHVCGWKDSLDTDLWPYFKPYQKTVKERVIYRYAANGIDLYAPDLSTAEPLDEIDSNFNTSFQVQRGDTSLPRVRPATPGAWATFQQHFSLPYLVTGGSLHLQGLRATADDSVAVDYGYWTIFTAEQVGAFDTLINLNDFAMVNARLVFRFKAARAVENAGINRFELTTIFQHNMFVLPQLEPGANQVTLASETGNLDTNALSLSFCYLDNNDTARHTERILANNHTYTVSVVQADMPKMISMALANKGGMGTAIEKTLPSKGPLQFRVWPNPSNHGIFEGYYSGTPGPLHIAVYDLQGRAVKTLAKGLYPNGIHFRWTARDETGRLLPQGVYVIRVTGGRQMSSHRVVLLR